MCYERIYLVGIVFPDNVFQRGQRTAGQVHRVEKEPGSKFQIQVCSTAPAQQTFCLHTFNNP